MALGMPLDRLDHSAPRLDVLSMAPFSPTIHAVLASAAPMSLAERVPVSGRCPPYPTRGGW